MALPKIYNLGSNKTGLPGLILAQPSCVGLWIPQHGVWNDLSPYGNNGTPSNVTYSGAAQFTRMPVTPAVFNLNGKVECGSDASLDNMAAITFVFWGTLASVGGAGAGRFIGKEGAAFAGPIWGAINASAVGGAPEALVFTVAHATTTLRVTTKVETYNFNVPVMLAVTWTGGTAVTTVKMYSSFAGGGTVVEKSTGASNDTAAVGARTSDAANAVVLGNRSASDRGHQGTISLIAAFNAVLTLADLQAFYATGVIGP